MNETSMFARTAVCTMRIGLAVALSSCGTVPSTENEMAAPLASRGAI